MTNLAAFLLGLVAGFLFMNFFGQKRVIHTDSFVEKQDVGKIKQKGHGNNMEAEHSLIERIFTPLKSNKEERQEKREARRQARQEREENRKKQES
jgi:hypothetical protein